MNDDAKQTFARHISKVISDEDLDVRDIAAGASLHRGTVYRALKGQGITKGKVIALISSINRSARRQLIEINEGLSLAGFRGDVLDSEYLSGQTGSEIIALIIDAVALLPIERQRDVLAIVDALAERNGVPRP